MSHWIADAETTTFDSEGLTMIEIRQTDDGIVHVEIEGSVTESETAKALGRIDAMLEGREELPFYIEINDVTEVELEALWKDLRFDARHAEQYGKTAIVGDEAWHEWGTKLFDLFAEAETEFFEPQDAGEAWDWVRE